MKSEKADNGFLFAFAVAAASAAVMGISWHLPWLAEDAGFHLKLVPLSASELAAQQSNQDGGETLESVERERA
jgi:hypothetical protein